MLMVALSFVFGLANASGIGNTAPEDCSRALQIESMGKMLPRPDAVDALEKLIAEKPGDPDVLSFLASSYAQAGRFSEAEAALERRIKITGPSARKLEQLIEYAIEGKRLARAAVIADHALRHAESDTERVIYLDYLAEINLRRGEWKQALRNAEQALDLFPQSVSIKKFKYRVMLNNEGYLAARSWFDALIREALPYQRINLIGARRSMHLVIMANLFQIAYESRLKGDIARGVRALTEIIKIEPLQFKELIGWAEEFLRSNKIAEATLAIEAVLSFDACPSQAHWLAARIFFAA